jgi:hypothetical protein
MTLNVARAPLSASPLWIIALFIALSEAMASVAAIATDGTTRLIFAVFAVGFPIVVLIVFLWMLLEHPVNLYSPAQYTSATPIDAYARATRRARLDAQIVFRQAAVDAIADVTEGEGAIFQVVERFDQIVEANTLTVDRSFVMSDADSAQIPVTANTTINTLLDLIYFSISDVVEPRTYGKGWLLTDADGVPLDIGRPWAQRRGQDLDPRTIGEAGIPLGSTLFVRFTTKRRSLSEPKHEAVSSPEAKA